MHELMGTDLDSCFNCVGLMGDAGELRGTGGRQGAHTFTSGSHPHISPMCYGRLSHLGASRM
eukprot:scaffold136006_cov20-Tisochrysis_lutea.AAC.1